MALTVSFVPARQTGTHLFGHGCAAAEWHEQSGPANAVHVSAAVMAALERATAAPSSPGAAAAADGDGGLRRTPSAWSITTSDAAEPAGGYDDEDWDVCSDAAGPPGHRDRPARSLSPPPRTRIRGLGGGSWSGRALARRRRSFILHPSDCLGED